MMEQVISQLKKSKRVLVASHANPDGDAIASLLAMALALDSLGKITTLYNESPLPVVYRFLPAFDRIQHLMGTADHYDTAVVLDCGNLERVGKVANVIHQIPVLINIDHHYTNDGFGHYHHLAPSACATAEIVYQLINAMGVSIDRDIASCIYTGILTDTGSFRFSNTNRSAFIICDEMVGRGVRPEIIAQHVYGAYSLGRIKLLNLALDSIEITPNGELALMVVTKDMISETGTSPCDADGLINYARSIETVKLAAMVQESMEKMTEPSAQKGFHVSLRSNGTVDVAAIAGLFGGGGHFTAAGFHLDLPLSEVKRRLFEIGDELKRWEPKACRLPERVAFMATNGRR
jgi:bifunctional oligoribonuclease and PAP phosphatase NrnA